jgi:hypothetical protein
MVTGIALSVLERSFTVGAGCSVFVRASAHTAEPADNAQIARDRPKRGLTGDQQNGVQTRW